MERIVLLANNESIFQYRPLDGMADHGYASARSADLLYFPVLDVSHHGCVVINLPACNELVPIFVAYPCGKMPNGLFGEPPFKDGGERRADGLRNVEEDEHRIDSRPSNELLGTG